MKIIGPALVILLTAGVASALGMTLNGAPLDWTLGSMDAGSSVSWGEAGLGQIGAISPDWELSNGELWLRDPHKDSDPPGNPAPTPEPGSLWLLGSGLCGLSAFFKLRRKG